MFSSQTPCHLSHRTPPWPPSPSSLSSLQTCCWGLQLLSPFCTFLLTVTRVFIAPVLGPVCITATVFKDFSFLTLFVMYCSVLFIHAKLILIFLWTLKLSIATTFNISVYLQFVHCLVLTLTFGFMFWTLFACLP